VSYFVLYVSSPCLVGLAAEINKTVKTVKLGRAISVIFGSLFSAACYCKADEVYFTTLLWQWATERPYIANIFFRFVQNCGE